MTSPAAVLPLGVSPGSLTRPARALYKRLAELSCTKDGRARGGTAVVGMAQLVRDTDYSESALRRAKRELVAAGLMTVLERGDGRRRSEYDLRQIARPQAVQKSRDRQDQRPPRAATVNTQGGHPDHPLRGGARLLDALLSSPQPPNADAPGGARSSDPAGSRCPRAAARGRPCGSCRACGTSPRALRVARQPRDRPWCGECHAEFARYVADVAGEFTVPCPRCHPKSYKTRPDGRVSDNQGSPGEAGPSSVGERPAETSTPLERGQDP